MMAYKPVFKNVDSDPWLGQIGVESGRLDLIWVPFFFKEDELVPWWCGSRRRKRKGGEEEEIEGEGGEIENGF